MASSLGGLCVATCGLDRHVRVHHVESGQCVAKLYMKSRLNCLLYSRHEPISKKTIGRNEADECGGVDDDRSINSEDLGTDDLWSDMETIVEEHPMLLLNKDGGDDGGNDLKKKIKRKMSQRLAEVNDDDHHVDVDDDSNFKKPK